MGALGGAQMGQQFADKYGSQISNFFGGDSGPGYGLTGNGDVTSLGSYGLGGGR